MAVGHSLVFHVHCHVEEGGFVIQWHNEVRDSLDFAPLVWYEVKQKPVVKEADEASDPLAIIADYACLRRVDAPG